MKSTSLFAGAVAATLLTVPALALAQNAAPVNIRGTIAAVDGHTLVVKSRDGKDVPITMGDKFGVLAMVKAKLSDIKSNDFVGAAAIKGTDGKLHAQEVLIFPEAARGTGEGHYPWDLTPDSTMTNATVAGVASMAKDRVLKLKYKGGENEIEVSPETPVVRFQPSDMSLLKPGAAVFVRAPRQPDGSITAQNALVEKEGVKPPM